jgi:hypothetical protein
MACATHGDEMNQNQVFGLAALVIIAVAITSNAADILQLLGLAVVVGLIGVLIRR